MEWERSTSRQHLQPEYVVASGQDAGRSNHTFQEWLPQPSVFNPSAPKFPDGTEGLQGIRFYLEHPTNMAFHPGKTLLRLKAICDSLKGAVQTGRPVASPEGVDSETGDLPSVVRLVSSEDVKVDDYFPANAIADLRSWMGGGGRSSLLELRAICLTVKSQVVDSNPAYSEVKDAYMDAMHRISHPDKLVRAVYPAGSHANSIYEFIGNPRNHEPTNNLAADWTRAALEAVGTCTTIYL